MKSSLDPVADADRWKLTWYTGLMLTEYYGTCTICGDPVMIHKAPAGNRLIYTQRCYTHRYGEPDEPE